MPAGPDTSALLLDGDERPRAFRREGLGRRVAPFAVTSIAIGLATPWLVTDSERTTVLLAVALNAVLVAIVFVAPWPRMPRWTEAAFVLSAFPVAALLRDGTGGGGSVLNAMVFLPVFWFSLHGRRADLVACLAALLATLVLPVVLIGGEAYPPEELVRATLWFALAVVIGFTVQRVVEASWRSERATAQTAALRASANEELREASDLKAHFVAMVSHELRTPLTSIRGFANTILHHYDELDDADRRRFAGIIEDQADRLSRLVEDLLALSRIESGAVTSRSQRLEVAAVVDQVVAQFRSEEIGVECEAGLRVLADPDHLEQMLVNLVANAQRYGAPPIRVLATHAGDCAQVVVEDAGPGVERDFVPLLFERFTQAGGTGSSGGTGLGLSIVRGLAQAEGGDAWYEAREHGGSRFGVTLPLANADLPG